MNGTMDVRDVFKEAVGEQGRNFIRGTNSTDAHLFFRHVLSLHYKKNKTIITYKFKQLGFNNNWDMQLLEKNLSKKGKYVFFGATRKNNESHNVLLKSISSQCSDTDKIETWIKGKQIQNDHAIGVDIDDNMQGTIYDNGCTKGEKFFTIQNLATRMRWMNQCYLMDLFIVKT
jgi:hypothetical protein